MSENSKSGGTAGIGIGGLIFVILLVGKLAGYFSNISWFWVITSIIWAPVIAVIVVLLALGAGALLVGGAAVVIDKISDARRNRFLLKEQKRRERMIK